MPLLSDRDSNRLQTPKELNELDEKNLTKRAFSRNLKNVFFGAGALGIFYIVSTFSEINVRVIGWIIILTYGLFALDSLFAFFMTAISVLGSSDKKWKLCQMLVSGITTALFITFAFLIHSKIK